MSFMNVFVNKYFLSTHHVLGLGALAVNKANKTPCPHGAYTGGGQESDPETRMSGYRICRVLGVKCSGEGARRQGDKCEGGRDFKGG